MKKALVENRKRIVITLVTMVVIVIVATGMFFYYKKTNSESDDNKEKQYGEVISENATGESIISASGTTSIGMVEETFDLDYLENDLLVEEVYVSSGDEIEAGQKILKVSDFMVAEELDTLEKAAELAELDYRSGNIDYEQGLIDAKKEYELLFAEASYAEEKYQNAQADLDAKLVSLEQQVTDAKETLDEYTVASVTANYYNDYYEVDEKLAIYYENDAVLQAGLKELGLTEGKLTANGVVQGVSSTVSDFKWRVIALYQLKTEVDENYKEYETAVKSCTAANDDLEKNLKEAENNYNSLSLDLESSKLDAEEEMVSLKSTYEESSIKSETAETTYNTAVKKLDETLSELKEAKEEAVENLELFKTTIGDGYLYADNNGTIMIVAVEAEGTIQANGMLLAYTDPDTVTVTVALDQTYVASVNVGDTANVSISGYGNFEGTVTEIVPTSTSESRTSITYDVTILLSGDISTLAGNLTAEVIFNSTEGN